MAVYADHLATLAREKTKPTKRLVKRKDSLSLNFISTTLTVRTILKKCVWLKQIFFIKPF
jgi:hypothetical protein